MDEQKDSRKIGIPKSLQYVLDRDMRQFEMVKEKDDSLAVNRFINALIIGYYDDYKQSLIGHRGKLQEILSPHIKSGKVLDKVIDQIIAESRPEDDDNRKTNGKTIRFRANKPTKDIDKEIYAMNISLAGFYRDMFISYSHKPVYERERIIFRDVTDVLLKACRDHTELKFSLRDNPTYVHTVVPYQLVYGTDEQFNYLLCQEPDQSGKKLLAVSYRLRRILHPKAGKVRRMIDPSVKIFLDKMIQHSPQYTINEEQEFCIEFTREGRKAFEKIYTGRPNPDTKGEPDEKGNCRYYFSCSQGQMYDYFKRFNPGQATVIYPEKLRDSLRRFHEKYLLGQEE